MSRAIEENTAVAIYLALPTVEAAVRELQNSGFDLKKVSIVAKDQSYGEERNADPDSEIGAGRGETFWKKMLRLLSGRTVYSLSNDEFVIVSGPLSECVTAALDNPVIFGRLSALSAALYILGIPVKKALKFEEDVQRNKFLVIANGTTDEISLAKRVFRSVNGAQSQEVA